MRFKPNPLSEARRFNASQWFPQARWGRWKATSRPRSLLADKITAVEEDEQIKAQHGRRPAAYVEGLVSVIGHADRAGPLRDYCTGLMLPCGRKSEPMAAVTAPERTAAQHQSLLHFVGNAGWLDQKVLAKVREMVLPQIERHGSIEAWIIDDTGFPKKGKHSGWRGSIAAI